MDHRTGRATADRALVVVTADPALLDSVFSVTAAVGVEPRVMSDVTALRPMWSRAATILIGVDQAANLAAMALPRRPGSTSSALSPTATRWSTGLCRWVPPS